MYSRRNSGYPRFTPPPNYNGVAFTRDYMPSSEVKESAPKLCEDVERETKQVEDTPICNTPLCELCDNKPDEREFQECKDESGSTNDNTDKTPSSNSSESLCTKLIGKELSIEDLLLIGAVILFVSGEFDGDLMLLLGLLLIAGL